MKFKFLNVALLSLLFITSSANAGIIHNFDFSTLDISDASYSEGSLDGFVISFEFEDSTDFNNFNKDNLLAWTVSFGSESYSVSNFYALNEESLFTQIGDDVFLNIGAAPEAYMYGDYAGSNHIQVGQGYYTSLLIDLADVGGPVLKYYTGSVLWVIPSTANQVPAPSTLAIFALGLIGLASRRFKKQS